MVETGTETGTTGEGVEVGWGAEEEVVGSQEDEDGGGAACREWFIRATVWRAGGVRFHKMVDAMRGKR